MILTSNLAFGSWDGAFGGDAVLTARCSTACFITPPSLASTAKAIG